MSLSFSAIASTAPRQTRKRTRSLVIAMVAVWTSIYVTSLFAPALLDDADTVHAEAASGLNALLSAYAQELTATVK